MEAPSIGLYARNQPLANFRDANRGYLEQMQWLGETDIGHTNIRDKIDSVSKKLRAVQRQLDKLELSYRIAVFEHGLGIAEGDLEDDNDMPYCGPQAIVKLRWQAANGIIEVGANESEWLTDGIDITVPDGRD